MKITLDIPDGIIAGFFNGVEVTAHGMQLVSYQLSTDDLKDGNTVKLPREQEVSAWSPVKKNSLCWKSGNGNSACKSGE